LKIIAGLPAYNVEGKIAPIIAKLRDIVDGVIVCNDGSSDLTGQIAKELGVIVIDHTKNLGYGAAIKSIFQRFLETDGDILVTIDADGQHNVEDIKKIVKPILDDSADLVIGSRFTDTNVTKIPRYRKMGISAITKITNISTKQKITDSQSGFRAYKREIISQTSLSETGMAVSTEILIKADRKNFRITEVGIIVEYPEGSSTHNPISHGTSVFVKTLQFAAIQHPLKFFGIPGIFFLIFGLGFIIWTLQLYAENKQITTNVALLGLSSTIFGVLLLMTSILLYSVVVLLKER
jgi:glycosyltransferase involved in cell wall biosynthesis